VLLSPRHEMTAGKAMAQAAHAAQLGWRASSSGDRAAWRADGFDVAVRVATPRQWADAMRAGAPVVQDAGFTEVEPGARRRWRCCPGCRERFARSTRDICLGRVPRMRINLSSPEAGCVHPSCQ